MYKDNDVIYSGQYNTLNKICLKIPTGGKHNSWLFTKMTEELN